MYDERFDVNDKGHLIFAGTDTVKLAEEFETPLYVFDEDGIRSRCREIRKALTDRYPNSTVLYASKALSNMAIYKIMDEEGLGIDVVSSGELYTALKAGFPAEKVYFHGNNKTAEEIEFGVESGVGHFVIDNLHELELLQKTAAAHGRTIPVLLRISPGVDAHTHDFISTGQLDSKFGFPIQNGKALEAAGRALAAENLEFVGVHCHIGSQILVTAGYEEAAIKMVELIQSIKEAHGYEVEVLNLGGGFGIRYNENEVPPPIEVFIEAMISTTLRELNKHQLSLPKIIIEPGRWLVGESGITLYKIGATKEIEGIRKYVSVDGGMADNPRPALYQAEYQALLANKGHVDRHESELVTISGKCCESGDILIRDIQLPKVEAGDILAVLSTGAYNYSMASNYNRMRKPAVVMVREGASRIVVKRETYLDLTRNDSL